MSILRGTNSEFRSALMEKGFYPENVPPVFRVSDFHIVAENFDLFSEQQIEWDKPCALARYDETKRGGQRRVFSVPNPLFFIDCAEFLTSNRKKVSPLLSRSKISRSAPDFDPNFSRAVKIEGFSDFNKTKKSRLSRYKYTVKIDISRFYHAIYTHSIPWAMHGKRAAKLDRKRKSQGNYGNMLDYLIRQGQDQQTIGIPVGPDISRIVGEIVSGAIDQRFERELGRMPEGARLIDDVYLAANTYEEAEEVLSTYREAIKFFELDINESKTRIFQSSSDLEDFWPVTIRRELERYQDANIPLRQRRADLVIYTDEIIRQAVGSSDEGVIRYAIRKMDDLKLWSSFWAELEPFLVRAIVNFPHCTDYVARVVSWRRRRAGVDRNLWQDICVSVISSSARLGHDSEVAWSCWLLKEIGGRLPGSLAELVVEKCGSLSALCVLDLESSGLLLRGFRRGRVYDRLGANPMVGNDWLLSYEAERLFGYRLKGKNRTDYAVFGDLMAADVAFYDDSAVPFVFQDIEDDEEVEEALENRIGLYDDEDDYDEDDYDEDDYDDDGEFF